MQDVLDFDFLVVGAGMAGASAAAYLSESGRVALIEGEQHAGYHSTGRSAALFSEIYGSQVIRALTRASRSFLFEPPEGFAPTPLVSPRGALYFARPDQLETLGQFLEDADVRSAAKELSRDEVAEWVPIFRSNYLGGGVLDFGAADLDVDAIHQGFLRQVRQRRSEIHLDSRVRTLRRESGLWLATTARACFRAPVVVNAAGAWGDELAALAGVAPVGLQPLRRTALLIPLPEARASDVWPAAIDISEQFYFKPDAGLLLLSPADEHPCAPCDAQPEELDVAIAIDLFEKATNIQVRQVRRRWAGLRVFSPDRSPVVGFDTAVEGFFWLVGQGGYGIQTAPALGRVAAALASGRSVPTDIADEGVIEAKLSKERFTASKTVIASA
jgi:D-arginine dehydrogenase